MEKLFLNFKLVGKKLDIVHDQKIILAVFFFKKMDVFVLDGEDVVIGEFFRSQVLDFDGRIIFSCFVADGLEKVGFPQADSAVNKKRIVKIADAFGNGGGGGMSHLIERSHHKS